MLRKVIVKNYENNFVSIFEEGIPRDKRSKENIEDDIGKNTFEELFYIQL